MGDDRRKKSLAIITPTYQRPELVKRLSESIISQSPKFNWVHIIIDDDPDSLGLPTPLEEYREEKVFYEKVESNKGALIARNIGIEKALSLNVDYIAFIDDDDVVTNLGLQIIENEIARNPKEQFFLFLSHKVGQEPLNRMPSTTAPISQTVSWIDDVVLGRKWGSDNLILLSSDLIKDTRFTSFGRNQREWTFFIKIAKRHDRVICCPKVVLDHYYHPEGLTSLALKKNTDAVQIWNTLSRAFTYYRLRPWRLRLALRFAFQLLATPIRLFLIPVKKVKPYITRN